MTNLYDTTDNISDLIAQLPRKVYAMNYLFDGFNRWQNYRFDIPDGHPIYKDWRYVYIYHPLRSNELWEYKRENEWAKREESMTKLELVGYYNSPLRTKLLEFWKSILSRL